MNQIYFSTLAEERLNDLFNYIESNWGKKSKDKFLEELKRCLKLISKNPTLFPFFDSQHQIRGCLITPHNSLLYTIKNNKIYIVTIWDNRMKREDIRDIFR